MKQCSVPRCEYEGEVGDWRTVYVPESPYKPSDMVVECPRCKRRSKVSDLLDVVGDFERRKREAMKEWVPLPHSGAEVCSVGGYVCERCRPVALRV